MKALEPQARHLSQDWRRVLQLVARTPRGTTEDLLVFAHGFSRDVVAGLVLAGHLTVVTETVTIGGPTIKVERVRITDAGRKAIED